MAFEQLERVGAPALPALSKALEGRPSLEVRRRAEELLRSIQAPVPPSGQLREIRAVAVLERAGEERARQLLRVLAEGLPGAGLTAVAKAALRRLTP